MKTDLFSANIGEYQGSPYDENFQGGSLRFFECQAVLKESLRLFWISAKASDFRAKAEISTTCLDTVGISMK